MRTGRIGDLAALHIGVGAAVGFAGHDDRCALLDEQIPQDHGCLQANNGLLAQRGAALGHAIAAVAVAGNAGALGLAGGNAILLVTGINTDDHAGEAAFLCLGSRGSFVALADSAFLLHHAFAIEHLYGDEGAGVGQGHLDFALVQAAGIDRVDGDGGAFLLGAVVQALVIRARSGEGVLEACGRFGEDQVFHIGAALTGGSLVIRRLGEGKLLFEEGLGIQRLHLHRQLSALAGVGQLHRTAEMTIGAVQHLPAVLHGSVPDEDEPLFIAGDGVIKAHFADGDIHAGGGHSGQRQQQEQQKKWDKLAHGVHSFPNGHLSSMLRTARRPRAVASRTASSLSFSRARVAYSCCR